MGTTMISATIMTTTFIRAFLTRRRHGFCTFSRVFIIHGWLLEGNHEKASKAYEGKCIASSAACHTAIYCVVERLQTFPCQRGDSKRNRQLFSDRLLVSPKSLTVGPSQQSDIICRILLARDFQHPLG
jgi:hypothetical protein